jgi:hypothetical protein
LQPDKQISIIPITTVTGFSAGLVKIMLNFALLLLKSDPTFIPHESKIAPTG